MIRLFLMTFSIWMILSKHAYSDHPNIIWIMADDLAVHDLGCYGQKLIRTPAIDQLAEEGMRFTQAYAGASVCAPSRCVLMTGKHLGHARVRGNRSSVGGAVGEMGERGRVPLREEDVTIAEYLSSIGYTTAITGKWGLGEPGSTGIPTRQGFSEWFGYLNQDHAVNYFPEYLWRNEERVKFQGNLNGQREQYSQDLFTDFALNFIRSHRTDPFFLYVAYTTPHFQLEVPDLGEYSAHNWPGKAREYAAMISRLDRDVGRIASLVDELGLGKNTLLVFCSDNGGLAPYQELFHSNGQLRGKKGDLHEGGLRVPAIARWTEQIPAGQVCDVPWSFADVFPTIMELAESQPESNMDGVSIAPLFRGESLENPNRTLYWENNAKSFQQAVRRRNWKAIRTGLDGPIELYNLANDPRETQNIVGNHPEVAEEMKTFLKNDHTESAEWPSVP